MAISRLASQDATGTTTGGNSVSATYAATPTANNLLIAIVGDTDGINNATAISGWTRVAGGNPSSSNEIWLFYKIATGTESTTVTATISAGNSANMAIYEYTGLATISVQDQNSSGSSLGSNTASTGTTGTTTVSNELVMVAGFNSGASDTFSSWTNSFNLRNSVTQTGAGLFTGDQIVSIEAAYSSTLTLSGGVSSSISTIIVTFKGGVLSVSPLTILAAG